LKCIYITHHDIKKKKNRVYYTLLFTQFSYFETCVQTVWINLYATSFILLRIYPTHYYKGLFGYRLLAKN